MAQHSILSAQNTEIRNTWIMTMHPELKHALDANLSVLEVIRLFTKHHSGVPGERIELDTQDQLKPSDPSFWDTWKPLDVASHLGSRSSASEACLSIHKGLTRDIISWLCDSGRRSNVYLIQEAQIGTDSAPEALRANAFSSICYDAHRFGLPLQDGPFIPKFYQLSSALAAHYPPFRRILTKILIDNTEVIKLPTRTQFKKLIYEPWKALQLSHPQYVAAPPVIVLRCDDPIFCDEEILHSIYEYASPRHGLPLLWIISFSPECKLPIQSLFDPLQPPRLSRPPVSYNDAPADTELFLHYRFSILRQKHKEMFTELEVWPSEKQMSRLTRIFMGSFDAVDVVSEFVDWESGGGPKAHLETFLAYTLDSPSPSNEQPYCALDHFYTHASSAIPQDLLSVVKQVLCVCYSAGHHSRVTSFRLACLLSLRHDAVLDVLPRLCRWAVIRRIENEIVRYMPSPFFRGFLEDAKRSRHFSIHRSEMRYLTYESYLTRVICHLSNPSESLKPVGRFAPKAHASEIQEIIFNALWAFYRAPDIGSHPEWTLLRRFDFRCLALSQFPWKVFFHFLEKLYAWDKNNSPNIVRVEPAGDLDRLFIEKCEGLAKPLDLEENFKLGMYWRELRPAGPKYVLLGLEARTVLVVLATRRGPGVKAKYCGFSIYTSAMLEYM